MIEKPRIVLINGSLHGNSANSNTLSLLRMAARDITQLGGKPVLVSPTLVTYKRAGMRKRETGYVLDADKVLKEIESAEGLIIGTGTHWGNVSDVLQRFLEDATPTESSKAWFCKPTGVIVSEHSTGGQTVLANLMLTLSNYGCLLPPQAGMVYSRAGQVAKAHGGDWTDDIWGPDDITSICKMVVTFAGTGVRKTLMTGPAAISPWPVDGNPASYHARWIKPPRPARRKNRSVSQRRSPE